MRGLATTPRPATRRGAHRTSGGAFLTTPRRGDQRASQRSLGVRAKRPLPKADPILVTKVEAARVLGMSLSHFQRHVQPYLRCVYSGQLTLYPYRDLEGWANEEATVDGQAIR